MTKLFSFRGLKGFVNEQQNQRPACKPHLVRKLVAKAKKLFRPKNIVQASPPFEPLPIPTAAQKTGCLQDETAQEVYLLQDKHTKESHFVDSDEDGQQVSDPAETSALVTGTGDDSGEPPTSSVVDLLPSDSLSQHTNASAHSSSLLHDDSQPSHTTLEALVPSTREHSLSGRVGGSIGDAESPTLLETVRRTLGVASTSSSSSINVERRMSSTPSENADLESPSSSWIGLVVNEDLRQDLMVARAVMIQKVYGNLGPINGLLSISTDEANNHIPSDHRNSPTTSVYDTEPSEDSTTAIDSEATLAEESDHIDLPSLFAGSGVLEGTEATTFFAERDEAAVDFTAEAGFVCIAQRQSEIDMIRRNRLRFSEYLVAALAEERDSLQVRFEGSYDSTARLHEIEMLNLKDDHDAEVQDLKQTTKDLRRRLAAQEKSVRTLRRDMKSQSDHCRATEIQLQELSGQSGALRAQLEGRSMQRDQLLQSFQERETVMQRQTEDLHDLREELARTRRANETSSQASRNENANLRRSHAGLVDRYNILLTGFNEMNAHRQEMEAQLEAAQTQLEAKQVALREQRQELTNLRALHNHVVAEKVEDFSWHANNSMNALAMKPVNTEEEISEATKQLRESFEEQIELSADLRRQLESAQASRKAKIKKLKRVVANQNQEKVVLEMALDMVKDQRDHRAVQYDEAAQAVASKLSFSSFARGLAERLILLQETRFALEAQFLDAKVRGDRAVLDGAIRKRHEVIKLEKRDAQIATLKQELGDLKEKLDNESVLTLLYKDVIDEEMPELRKRNSEVERMLEDQVQNNVNANHQVVFDDLRRRNRNFKSMQQYWEHEMAAQLSKYQSLQATWGFFGCCVHSDLTNARSWRNDRDRLEVENVAFRERFADELWNEPLVIPEDQKTRQDLEDDFKLESINECLLKQYGETWKAVPKELLDHCASPWEYIRVDLKEDFEEQKKRWLAERDALTSSFENEALEIPNDHEWIDDPDDFEAMWKGKPKETEIGNGKETGEGGNGDRQLIGVGGPAGRDPTSDFF